MAWSAMRARSKAKGLFGWEHRLNHVTGLMERTGHLLNADYASMRVAEPAAEEVYADQVERSAGIARSACQCPPCP